eukprot:3925632-Alexandrium_andersonii.AAC.1
MLSGCVSYVFKEGDYRRMEAVLCAYARKCLGGAACRKTMGEDGCSYEAIPNSEVRARMRMAS